MAERFAEISVPLPVEATYTYRVPPDMVGRVQVGARVLVPFGGRVLTAFVVGLSDRSPVEKTKDIRELLDSTPLIDREVLGLCRWIAAHYFCPLGIAIRAALPAGLLRKGRIRVVLVRKVTAEDDLKPTARSIVDRLIEQSPRPGAFFTRSLGRSRVEIQRALASLEAKGIVRLEPYIGGGRVGIKTRKIVRILEETGDPGGTIDSTPRQRECFETIRSHGGEITLAALQKEFRFSASVIDGLKSKGLVRVEEVEESRVQPYPETDIFGEGWDGFTPGEDQFAALAEIREAIDRRMKEIFLLHGVSGSGKTVVYIEAIKSVLAVGRSAILLVPEIALTPQTVSRLSRALDCPVALYHSALSEGERYDVWRKARSGEIQVVVGARSAIFSPVHDLGVIVIDEEHETTYKQEEMPRYHAREVALQRAEMTDSVVILGSATPSLESYWRAKEGIYRYRELPYRYRLRPTPEISIVDMRDEPRWRESWFISETLGEKVAERIEKGEQSILFLNRRGHSTFLQCPLCGWVGRCHQCDISLTFHRYGNSLVCHYCDYREDAPDACPSCRGMKLRLRGLGTEQIEEVINDSFPGVRIARMDLDSTAARGAHRRILERLHHREVDILLGTQMVTKGLDFPGITLVGVVNADASIHFPDLRSSERTFHLLAQVAGRSGREGGGGEVVLQTFLPENEVLKNVEALDFAKFAEAELGVRRDANYPPFYNLVNVIVTGKNRQRVIDVATVAVDALSGPLALPVDPGSVEVLGPAPCLVERVRGDYRWHFIIKSRNDIDPAPCVEILKARVQPLLRKDIHFVIDRDPISFP
jgi:primosomal protein N' (replication factor Y)